MGTPYPKLPPKEKKKKAPLKRTAIVRKYKPTGELAVMKQRYEQEKGICQVTGLRIEFTPSCAMHVLSKGARPDLRLNPKNILIVIELFHFLYDNSSKEKVIKHFPQAEWVYELKQKLKSL